MKLSSYTSLFDSAQFDMLAGAIFELRIPTGYDQFLKIYFNATVCISKIK